MESQLRDECAHWIEEFSVVHAVDCRAWIIQPKGLFCAVSGIDCREHAEQFKRFARQRGVLAEALLAKGVDRGWSVVIVPKDRS